MNLQHTCSGLLCEQLKLGRIGANRSHLAQAADNEELNFADVLERLLVADAEVRGE